jgi:hypothetical protein
MPKNLQIAPIVADALRREISNIHQTKLRGLPDDNPR